MNVVHLIPTSRKCVTCLVFGLVCQTISLRVDAAPRSNNSSFVAVGTLVQHARARNGSPRFVLINPEGRTEAFVRAAPGVNLPNYSGQQVGLTARAISIHGSRDRYILAEQVTPLAPQQAPTPVVSPNQALGLPSDIVHAEATETLPGPELIPYPLEHEPIVSPHVDHEIDPIHRDPPVGGCGPKCKFGCKNQTCASCPCGPPGQHWVRAEHLLWWTKGMDIPALVTTGPFLTPGIAGVRGENGTRLLLGNESILEDSHSGLRIRGGKWLDYCRWFGVEGEYSTLFDDSNDYLFSGNDFTVLARPFFNGQNNAEDSELVAFPNIVNGIVHVDSESELHSAGLRFRMNLCCEDFDPPACSCGTCVNPCGSTGGFRFDFLAGYRFMNLDERLAIREQLSANLDGVITNFNVVDSFDTENTFHGGEVGISWEGYRARWSLELLGKLAFGNNHQEVTVNGSTAATTGGITTRGVGGLLALPSNIGRQTDDEFSIIPEFGATLGFALTPSLRVTAGYSFLYWTNVVRPGDQIDLTVDTDQLPPASASNNSARPHLVLDDTDFWAQGLNFGVDYRW